MPRGLCRIVAIDCDAALGQRLLTSFWGPEYDFHWFADGREALGKLQEIRPDVIVCELMLPGLDGRALLETVRLWPELRDVPFLVLSKVRSEAIIRAMLDAGANAYLVKPCPISQLKQAILEVLEERPQRPDRDLGEAPDPAQRSGPVTGTGPGTAVEPPMSIPPQATPMEGQPTRRARQKARKRKLPAALAPPAAGPEPTHGPDEVDATLTTARPARSRRKKAPETPVTTDAVLYAPAQEDRPATSKGETLPPREVEAAGGGSAIDSVPWEPLGPPSSTRPSTPWWSYSSRVAAALLALSVLSDTPARESGRAVAPKPPPSGVSEPTLMRERSEAPGSTAAPTATPTAEEPSPQAPVEPVAARSERAQARVDNMVRGRLQWAQALYDVGRYDDARAALGEVFKLAPSNAQARALGAQLHHSVAGLLPGGAPSDAHEEDHRAVLALLGRYQAALEQRDLAGLMAIWPSVDSHEPPGRWKDVRSRQLALRLLHLEVRGDEAVAMCVSYEQLRTTDGEALENNARVTFHLRRDNGSWLIDAVK